MSEDSPVSPQTLYGITKYAGELIVKNTCKTQKIVLRPVFGFGDYPDDLHSALTKVIYVLYRNIIGKETNLTVLLDKLIPKSYTRVENIANCILNFASKLFESNSCYSYYNIGENHLKALNWFQLLNIIEFNFSKLKVCDKEDVACIFKEKIEFVQDKDYLHYHNMDDLKIKNIGFNFDSQKNYVNIDHGIEKTIDSVIKNIEQEPYWL
jgi:nucleoside-diphosphate-sugar epimerase